MILSCKCLWQSGAAQHWKRTVIHYAEAMLVRDALMKDFFCILWNCGLIYVSKLISMLKYRGYTSVYIRHSMYIHFRALQRAAIPSVPKADQHVLWFNLCAPLLSFSDTCIGLTGWNTQNRTGRNGQQHTKNNCWFRYLLAKWTHDRSWWAETLLGWCKTEFHS